VAIVPERNRFGGAVRRQGDFDRSIGVPGCGKLIEQLRVVQTPRKVPYTQQTRV
jgi:hypothetical protein